MRNFTFVPEGTANCKVTAWLQTGMVYEATKDKCFPSVVICPGGGYEFIAEREAEPVAKVYFGAGYHVFILEYSVGERAREFEPLLQLAATVAHIRKYAREWKLLPDCVCVCGFSAGGHLAASLGCLYRERAFLQRWGRGEKIRPDAMVLGYPVITADEYAHEGSIQTVSGAEKGTDRYAWFGLDRHVDAQTPPAFLWHTAADAGVPVENSLRFAEALSAAKVPFELHVFPTGEHGLSVCTQEVGTPDPYNARWTDWSVQWLDRTFGFQR